MNKAQHASGTSSDASSRASRIAQRCPICEAADPVVMDHRPSVPILQNRVWPSRESARSAPTGELTMVLCQACGFAWNSTFDPELMVYDPDYDNDQIGSEHYRDYLVGIMNRLVAHLPSHRPLHLVEVGFGQGAFLSQLAAGQGNRFASLTGFDPAWRRKDNVGERVKIHPCYFGSETVDLVPGRVDIIVSRHTIEHIPDPIGFLRTIRSTMDAESRLFLETPDIRWILETFQPQDLFYEHCSIFSENAFRIALAASGFAPVNIDRVFGDQYFWVESRPASDGIRVPAECDLAQAARTFATRRDRFIQRWRERINEFSSDGPVWLWGAASKGVTFALLVDPDASRLAGAIDLNPNKVGRFMAMTGLKIESPDALPDGAAVIVMNPNYRSEISAQIDAMGKTAKLSCIDEV